MTPETALTEIARGLQMALLLGAPLLLAVLVVGVVVGVLQAATQINEPTIAFVAKAVAMVATLALVGHFLLGRLVAFTTELYQRIPHLIG
ncbi:flagellar biosynthetic protein FliQ [Aerolutibacter ruishenii]|uniref:Flagellar biosynthetic protein FliQ n=1 Tax=Aerolutibacter ruishenii TaxID=686800 RepID=A0A562LKA7_9GAMM|nr:flagellar biosynthetic protein FliQ [Lysobacter ruishenii]TWI08016.1 flagellar biosynthetic protein FliQ [Lysobacter ruishenii]